MEEISSKLFLYPVTSVEDPPPLFLSSSPEAARILLANPESLSLISSPSFCSRDFKDSSRDSSS